jgi:hypothetical protein
VCTAIQAFVEEAAEETYENVDSIIDEILSQVENVSPRIKLCYFFAREVLLRLPILILTKKKSRYDHQ